MWYLLFYFIKLWIFGLDSRQNKVHNGISYKCDYCEQVSYNKYILKYHIKQKHAEEELIVYDHQIVKFSFDEHKICEACNKLYKTEKEYKRHVRQKHRKQAGLSRATLEFSFKFSFDT